ncbi:MAG: HdeD family acid-resistance protein [Octadecabacter sp.]
MSDITHPTGSHSWHLKPATLVGLGFAILGGLALLAPAIATTTTVVFLAVTLLFWGALGAMFVLQNDAFPNRIPVIVGFGLLALTGTVFLFFPTLGSEVLTIFLVAGLLMEGVFSILYAIKMSSHQSAWIWMALSGVAALAVGILVIIGWPATASWMIGLGLGVNFLTTGIAILAIGRASSQ